MFHYHLDHLGSTQVETDATGTVSQLLRYAPYGEVKYRMNNTFAKYEFTGYETEPLTELRYARARFYDPDLGLFLTQDPVGEFPSPYTYVGGDPINLTDPTGTCAACGAHSFGGGLFLQGLAAQFFSVLRGIAAPASPAPGASSAAAGPAGPIVTQPSAAAAANRTLLHAYQLCQPEGGAATTKAFDLDPSISTGATPVAQGGNGAGGKQVAGLESDAQTVEPGLQPGDRSSAMILGERVRGAQVRAMIAKYGGNIDAAASEFGVDADLIRGIIFEEQAHLLPGEGLAERYGIGRTVGLGQVSEGLHGFTRAQLLDPATNIRAIGTHLSHLQGQPLIVPRAPLASLATSYNCGSCTAITAYGRRVVFYRLQFLGGP